jgi:hypothetical protein
MFNNQLERKIKTADQDIHSFEETVKRKTEGGYNQDFDKLKQREQVQIIKDGLEEHKTKVLDQIHPELLEKAEDAESVVLRLSPDADDERIEELFGLMKEVGVINTINAIEKTESFHILDDFHRFLVQYIKGGFSTDIDKKKSIYPGLHMTLFEIVLPSMDQEEDEVKQKKLDELLLYMEQFYAGMVGLSESGKRKYFSIEISYPQERGQVSFYCAIPDEKIGLFQNQLLGVFSDAKLKEVTDDYNIFNGDENVAGSELEFSESEFLPIKTYKELGYDPLNIILQSFANFSFREGASIQILLSPSRSDKINSQFLKKIDKLNNGGDIKTILGKRHKIIVFIREVIKFFKTEDKEKDDVKDREKRNVLVEQLKNKNYSRLYNANIRFITAGENKDHAKMLLNELESSFLQFENANGNRFVFKHISQKNIKNFVRKYTFRVFEKDKGLLMNISELTSLFHFPRRKLGSSDLLSSSNMSSAQISNKVLSLSKKEQSEQKEGDEIEQQKKKHTDVLTTFNPEDENNVEPEEIEDFRIEDVEEILEERKKEQTEKEDVVKNSLDNFSINKDEYFEQENKFLHGNTPLSELDLDEGLKEVVTNDVLKDSNKKGGLENMGDASLSEEKNIILGVNDYQGKETPIYFTPLDRMRHMYVIGQTGTGKTTLLKNMIAQDIKNGDGICFIDPHGSDIEDILAQVPKERMDDVIYFDPAHLERPMGLNMLEYDARYPEQKSFVVNELLAIFEKLFDMKKNGSGGPMFEMYFRNAVMLAIDDPNDNATLFDVSRVLSDADFRKQKLAKSSNMIVNQF